MFFGAYLEDRLKYASTLRDIENPLDDDALLSIGDDISFNDVYTAAHEKYSSAKKLLDSNRPTATMDCKEIKSVDENIWVLNPALQDYEVVEWEHRANQQGVRIAELEEYPMIRGEFSQVNNAENYFSLRWNFTWEGYVILGIPDGITDEFVYEYKSTRNKYFLELNRPVALAQADLYGYFFQRDSKRVQFRVEETAEIITWDDVADTDNAINALKLFSAVDAGWEPPSPNPGWKCNKCAVRASCSLKQPE